MENDENDIRNNSNRRHVQSMLPIQPTKPPYQDIDRAAYISDCIRNLSMVFWASCGTTVCRAIAGPTVAAVALKGQWPGKATRGRVGRTRRRESKFC